MTSDYRTMPAGRELDALVAERVMGLVSCTSPMHANGDGRPCHASPDSPDQGADTKEYSTDIAAAWLVVEHFASAYYNVALAFEIGSQDGWRCEFPFRDGEAPSTGYGETAPEAICRAALAEAERQGRLVGAR